MTLDFWCRDMGWNTLQKPRNYFFMTQMRKINQNTSKRLFSLWISALKTVYERKRRWMKFQDALTDSFLFLQSGCWRQRCHSFLCGRAPGGLKRENTTGVWEGEHSWVAYASISTPLTLSRTLSALCLLQMWSQSLNERSFINGNRVWCHFLLKMQDRIHIYDLEHTCCVTL